MRVPLQRILVPTDFSACSRLALAHAAAIGRPFQARIDLLHVYFGPHEAGRHVLVETADGRTMTLEQLTHTQAAQELADFLADPATPVIDGLHTELASGDPYRVILQHAETGHYDLVVVGTHGRSGISRLLMGSVAEKVVRHAPCPVLSVREPLPQSDGRAVPDLGS